MEQRLRKAEASAASIEAWTRGLRGLQKALAGGDVELRLRLRAHLRELIDKIEVFAIGFTKLAATYATVPVAVPGPCFARQRGQKRTYATIVRPAPQDTEDLAEYIEEM